jgi:hypothetical protein
MKKIYRSLLLFSLLLFSFPFLATAMDTLGAGSWDYVGSDVFTTQSDPPLNQVEETLKFASKMTVK